MFRDANTVDRSLDHFVAGYFEIRTRTVDSSFWLTIFGQSRFIL